MDFPTLYIRTPGASWRLVPSFIFTRYLAFATLAPSSFEGWSFAVTQGNAPLQ